MDDVSVVLATYNGERFIREQLESILAQTRPPREIVVSDDCSTDATCLIVQAMAEASSVPIVLVRNEQQLGFADNFLSACDSASGRFIAFSDQDDRWAPEKLSRGVAALAEHGAVLSAHAVGHIDVDGRRLERGGDPDQETVVITPDDADPWGNFLGFTMLFERSLLEIFPASARGMDPHSQDASLSHDRWVWFLASTFGSMVRLDERLADYRQHGGQLYGGEKPRSVAERIATRIEGGEAQITNLAEIARHRAALLEQDGVREPERRMVAARRWRAREAHLRRSAALYAPARRVRLPGRLARNLATGVYLSADGGLGRTRLTQDAVVVAARVLWTG